MSGGAEALVFGVLVFVVGTLLALNGWAVLDADLAAGAAAREATRTIVAAGGAPRDQVEPAMRDAAAATMDGHGKDGAAIEVVLVDDPWAGGTPVRCARVTVEVRYPVPGVRLPLVGGWQTPITATGRHTERMDPLRSGLAGRSGCG